MVSPTLPKTASQSLHTAVCKKDENIFSGGMYVGENSYQAANVQKEPPLVALFCALQRPAASSSEKRKAVFT